MILIKSIVNSESLSTYDFAHLQDTEGTYQIIHQSGFVDSVVSTLYIHQQVLTKLSQWVEQSLQLLPVPETGGFILGAARFQAESDAWEVVMEQFVPAQQIDVANPHRLEFGIGSLEEMDDARTLHPHLELVAWFHTHPGHTPYLSSIDLNTHNSFFLAPHYVAIVLDSLTENWDTGFFTRQRNGTMNNKADYIMDEWAHWKTLANTRTEEDENSPTDLTSNE